MKLKYPRYSKKENLACKLTEEDIEEVRFRRSAGESAASLARRFNVCVDTIYVWTNDEYRKRKREANVELQKLNPLDRETANKYHNRMMARKRKVKPEFKKYKAESNQACPYYKNRKIRYATDPKYAQALRDSAIRYYHKKKLR